MLLGIVVTFKYLLKILKPTSLFAFRTKQWMWTEQNLFALMMIPQRTQLQIVHPYKFVMIRITHQTFIIRKKITWTLQWFWLQWREWWWYFNLSRKNVGAYGQTKGQFHSYNFFSPCWTQILLTCTLMSYGLYGYCASCFKGWQKLDWRLIFFNGYRDGDCVFYISATDSKRNVQFVDDEVPASWGPNWAQANAVFESLLDTDPSFTL